MSATISDVCRTRNRRISNPVVPRRGGSAHVVPDHDESVIAMAIDISACAGSHLTTTHKDIFEREIYTAINSK